jgi:hypothetical protein
MCIYMFCHVPLIINLGLAKASTNLGLAKVVSQRASEFGKQQEKMVKLIEEEVSDIPEDKKDRIFKLLLDVFSGAQVQIESAKLDAAASVSIPWPDPVPMLEGDGDEIDKVVNELPACNVDQDDDPLGLGFAMSPSFVAEQEVALQLAAGNKGTSASSSCTKPKSLLASQIFETSLQDAAPKRQRSRNNFPKGDSPRPSPKTKTLETPALPPSIAGISNVPH